MISLTLHLQQMKPTMLCLQQLRFQTLIESELFHYLTYIMDQVDIYSNKEQKREKAKKREGQRVAMPPQIFNTETYCGASSHSIHSIHDSCLFM